MNFEFSDEQQQLHDTVDRYLTEQYTLREISRRQRLERGLGQSGMDRAWRRLGVLALNVPAAQGGLGFGPLETLAVMGACGRSLLLEPFLSSAVIATAAAARLRRRCGRRGVADSHGRGRSDRGAGAFRAATRASKLSG